MQRLLVIEVSRFGNNKASQRTHRNRIVPEPGCFIRVSRKTLFLQDLPSNFISPSCKAVVNCALLVAINILSGTNRQADALISCDAIPAFMKLLQKDCEPNVIKNVCFALSNVAASGLKHIESLLGVGVYTKLVEIYDSDCHASIKTEILHVFSNTLCNNNFNDSFCKKLGTSFIHIFINSLSSGEDHAIASLHALICFFKTYKFLPNNGKIGLKTHVNSILNDKLDSIPPNQEPCWSQQC